MANWLICALSAIALLVVWLVPKWQTRNRGAQSQPDRFSAENEARKTITQIIGGLAILAGLYFTNKTLAFNTEQLTLAQKQFTLAQSGQITDRFARATDQLGNSQLATRLGSLIAFERLARGTDTTDDYWNVMALVSIWVQAQSRYSTGKAHGIPPDIQRALSVLADRDAKKDPKDEVLDLSGTDLRAAYLYRGHLDHIDFSGAHLEGAQMSFASFNGSDLTDAILTGAIVQGADLSGAEITGDQLNGVIGDADTKLPPDVQRPKQWK